MFCSYRSLCKSWRVLVIGHQQMSLVKVTRKGNCYPEAHLCGCLLLYKCFFYCLCSSVSTILWSDIISLHQPNLAWLIKLASRNEKIGGKSKSFTCFWYFFFSFFFFLSDFFFYIFYNWEGPQHSQKILRRDINSLIKNVSILCSD